MSAPWQLHLLQPQTREQLRVKAQEIRDDFETPGQQSAFCIAVCTSPSAEGLTEERLHALLKRKEMEKDAPLLPQAPNEEEENADAPTNGLQHYDSLRDKTTIDKQQLIVSDATAEESSVTPHTRKLVAKWLGDLVPPQNKAVALSEEECGNGSEWEQVLLAQLRQQRNEKLCSWFAAAGLHLRWFADLLPLPKRSNFSTGASQAVFGAVEEIYRRLLTQSSPNGDAVVVHRTYAWFLQNAMEELYPGVGANVVNAFSSTNLDLLVCSTPISTSLLPTEDTSPTSPNFDRAEACGFAPMAPVSFKVFSTVLLLLVEPWCFSGSDAAEMLSKIVLNRCLVIGSERGGPPKRAGSRMKGPKKSSTKRQSALNTTGEGAGPPFAYATEQVWGVDRRKVRSSSPKVKENCRQRIGALPMVVPRSDSVSPQLSDARVTSPVLFQSRNVSKKENGVKQSTGELPTLRNTRSKNV